MKPTLPPPRAPRPHLLRRPRGGFGWLDARLLHEGWLPRIGPDGIAVLTFLALVADGRGASFYRRERMAHNVGLPVDRLDAALVRLVSLGLVDFRPWKAGHRDGVWQILPLEAYGVASPPVGNPVAPSRPRAQVESAEPTPVADVLRSLGLGPR